MWGWIVHCLKNYAVFSGRASRPEYWWFYLFTAIGSAIATFVRRSVDPAVGVALLCGWTVFTLIPSWAVTTRRLHDTAHSAWRFIYPILAILPILVLGWSKPAFARGNLALGVAAVGLLLASLVLTVWLIVLLCRGGDPGPNRYGDPAPTAPEAEGGSHS